MRILVINAGSSTIKYHIFDMSEEQTVVSGLLDCIGSAESRLHHTTWHTGVKTQIDSKGTIPDHHSGLIWITETLQSSGFFSGEFKINAIGHRVVHGGESFSEPVLIDAEVIKTLSHIEPLAPMHNPANLIAVRLISDLAPELPQVAVFDTAFHQTLQPHAYRYALPEDFYFIHKVRRYGFHGTSHQFIAESAADWLGRPLQSLCLITLHLGNGASATAIKHGHSVDTSMGMTPLEGLIMGTRCGDIDPAIPYYMNRLGWSFDEIEHLLNYSSGLMGICGTSDMREIEKRAKDGDERACLAIELTGYRLRKYIGAYLAVLGRLDAIIFSGGIGEHSSRLRANAIEGLTHLGIEIDEQRNTTADGKQITAIEHPDSKTPILVIPTNEALMIARQTDQLLTKGNHSF
jgi:acetate kinase